MSIAQTTRRVHISAGTWQMNEPKLVEVGRLTEVH